MASESLPIRSVSSSSTLYLLAPWHQSFTTTNHKFLNQTTIQPLFSRHPYPSTSPAPPCELLTMAGWWALLTAGWAYVVGWGGGGAGVAGAGVRYMSAESKKRGYFVAQQSTYLILGAKEPNVKKKSQHLMELRKTVENMNRGGPSAVCFAKWIKFS